MMNQGDVFADLLSKALHRMRAETGRSINAIEDELGNLLGKAGRTYIQHLRKGNLPGNRDDAATLARELVRHKALTQTECLRLLRSADLPDAQTQVAEMFENARPSTPNKPPTREPLDSLSISKPVAPAQFVGRARELRQVLGWWRKAPMQDGIVIGPRRSGKTSLARYLEQCLLHGHPALPAGTSYRVVNLDFSLSSLCQLQPLLRCIVQKLGLDGPAPENLEQFMDLITCDDCWRVPTVFLLDEVELALKSPEITTPFWNNMRYLVNTVADGNLAFLLFSKSNPADVAKQEGKTSHFFNILKTQPLGPLATHEAQTLVNNVQPHMPPEDVDWLLTHSHQWPVVIQMLCQEYATAQAASEPLGAWRTTALAQLDHYRHLWEG